MRRMEELLGEMAKAGKTRGPLHRRDEQEAVGVGVCAALNADDYVSTMHRGHHVYVDKGLDPRRIVAEIFGRSKDLFTRAAAYATPGEKVDGNDAIAVFRSVAAAAQRAWRGSSLMTNLATGAAQGIGAAAALLSKQREELCVFDRQDPGPAEHVDRAIAGTVERFGRTDDLVTAAGGVHIKPALGGNLAELADLMSISVGGSGIILPVDGGWTANGFTARQS